MNPRLSSIILEDCARILNSTNNKSLKEKKILLTGSNGFFGRYVAHLIHSFNKKNSSKCTLYCISLHRPNKDIRSLAKVDPNIIPIQKDLTKNFSFKPRVDYILHAASYAQPQKFIENKFSTIDLNVNTTKKLLDIAKKNNARFLFFSSAEVYGNIPKNLIPVPETYNGNSSTTAVRAIYGESKRLGETICSIYRRDYGLNVFIARISHVYGPGISPRDKRVLGEFIKKASQQYKITLLDQGTAMKTFGYIADIVQMLFTLLLKGKDMIYNIGGTDTISIKKLAELVADYYNVPVEVSKEKIKLLHIGTDPQLVKLDLSKYLKDFGNFKFTTIKEGIKKTLDWNKEKMGI